MKKFLSLIVLIVFSVAMVAAQAKSETTTYAVSMTCGKCKANIEKNIPFEKGVKDLKVNLDKKEVTVTYDPTKTSKETIKKAFEKLKFKAEAKN